MNAHRTVVPGDAAHLDVLTRFLQEFWSAAQLPSAHALYFELALEEVFMNIVMHGSYPDLIARVELSLLLADGGLTMTVEDDGPPFNPLSLPTPDLDAGLAERRIGGLGVYFVRRMMDAVSYDRVGAQNRLTMSKSLAG
ncbi:MAG: ATP-binding protein [Proteobacteria bacterium]|nr:ATP-binding protein [Pseudomonadota bacterium]